MDLPTSTALHSMMNKNSRMAIIGSGPSALYLLHRLLRYCEQIGNSITEITVFDRGSEMGAGMPYSQRNTDRYNLCNISSEEIPELEVSFADWLKTIDVESREAIGVEDPVCEKATYPRIALGRYFMSQWEAVCSKLSSAGIAVREKRSHEIIDIVDGRESGAVLLKSDWSGWSKFDRVVIATGHHWKMNDRPNDGYFQSPWPIHKLLPKNGQYFAFPVGLLGASLSAFDVATSLAHRHGRYIGEGDDVRFVVAPECGDFKIVMHSTNGWLPHLQYEQREPFRDIYRHVSRDELLALVDSNGFLRLDIYFDIVCRPALLKAFGRDHRSDMLEKLNRPEFGLTAFVDQMSSEHNYCDPFQGMRKEMTQAKASVENDRPVHWKEVMDDLMYTLNFHAHLMSAEDHLTLHSLVMPFLMNVIAALPLESARELLALRDAGCLEIVEGHVEVVESDKGNTSVCVECNGKKTIHRYRLFVDCSGQKSIGVSEYPFESLVRTGAVRTACARFAEPLAVHQLDSETAAKVVVTMSGRLLEIGGIDIDSYYRVIGEDGKPNQRIYDIAFPHTFGLRPYSYGLQTCAETARIVVENWCADEVRARDATSMARR